MLIDEQGVTGNPSREAAHPRFDVANLGVDVGAAQRQINREIAATREEAIQTTMRLYAERGALEIADDVRALLVDLRERLRALPAERIHLDVLMGRRIGPYTVEYTDRIDENDCNSVGCIMGWAIHFNPERNDIASWCAVVPLLFSPGASGEQGKRDALARLDIVLGDRC